MKSTGSTGTNAVDWEERVDMERLRDARLARLKEKLAASDLGALLAFDFSNIRYMSATHIGTWAMDKLIRFSLLTRNSDPISWDFGSAAKHHALYNPWLDVTTAEMDADPNAPHENAARPRAERFDAFTDRRFLGCRGGLRSGEEGVVGDAVVQQPLAKAAQRVLAGAGPLLIQ